MWVTCDKPTCTVGWLITSKKLLLHIYLSRFSPILWILQFYFKTSLVYLFYSLGMSNYSVGIWADFSRIFWILQFYFKTNVVYLFFRYEQLFYGDLILSRCSVSSHALQSKHKGFKIVSEVALFLSIGMFISLLMRWFCNEADKK